MSPKGLIPIGYGFCSASDVGCELFIEEPLSGGERASLDSRCKQLQWFTLFAGSSTHRPRPAVLD
jgi:hypothetical protein